MIKLLNDGYVFISKRNIQYEILEGMGIGTIPRYTSDMIFIFLMDSEFDVDNNCVGYLFGAQVFEKNPKAYEESIEKMINEFEERNFETE